MGELLILAVVLGVLGIGAWIIDLIVRRPRSVDAHADDWPSENGGWR